MNKIKKQIKKSYWKNGQKILFDHHFEYTAKKGYDGWVDVSIIDKNRNILCWFEIINLKASEDVDFSRADYYFGNSLMKPIKLENPSEIANKPLYLDYTFYLKKFEPITDKDIEACVKYFIKKILGLKLLFNFEKYNEKKNYNTILPNVNIKLKPPKMKKPKKDK